MLRSMTGYGFGDAPLESARVVVEARSVNHRFLDVRARMPREIAEHGMFCEQLARGRFSRGRVELNVHLETSPSASIALDKARASAAYRALTELRNELSLAEPVPLSLLAAIPDLFVSPLQADREAVRAALQLAVHNALGGLDAMRENEGTNLHADLLARVAQIAALAGEIGALAPELGERYRRRFREHIARLMGGVDVTLDPIRLEQEVAIAADRTDIAEELTRLASHCKQFHALLDVNEPAGRRLEFLLQEMGREVNTIGAKAAEVDVSLRVVELKASLEKMREQVQNVE